MTDTSPLTVADLWLELARLPHWLPVYVRDQDGNEGAAYNIETSGSYYGGIMIETDIGPAPVADADEPGDRNATTLKRIQLKIDDYRQTNAKSDAYNPIGVEALLSEIESLCDDDIPF